MRNPFKCRGVERDLEGLERGERLIVALLRNQAELLEEILNRLPQPPQLTNIQLKFSTGGIMAEGPVVLAAGQSTVASIDYFDQTGAPMPAGFVPPAASFSIDDATIASSTPSGDGLTDAVAYVSAGVANLSVSLTSAEGLALSDTESVTCSPDVIPPPVLSSIRLNFSTPA